jgi:D-ribose pyranase
VKKSEMINQPISAVIAGMGHLDELVIADAGLPIPPGTTRIDLALTRNVPSFLQTLQVVLGELEVESAVVAQDMLDVSPDTFKAIQALMADIPIEFVSHETFKQQTRSAKAVIRTGEFTPYANIILRAGVLF